MLVKYLGFDLSTSGLAVGVRGVDGQEDFASTPILGATTWHGQPAFDLGHIPAMMEKVLRELREKGWEFFERGAFSFSVRQHDMVLLDKAGELIMPALSWQCHAATKQAEWINGQPIVNDIGKVEARFILPKLMWALSEDSSLRDKIGYVMTTGDYISYKLTGAMELSTSDAVSNGLLIRGSKRLAESAIVYCDLNLAWFPEAIDSGEVVGSVAPATKESSWHVVSCMLQEWKVVSCLGDNHAGAVGCGLNSDQAIVVSAGTSGTVVRLAHEGERRLGQTAVFEYYGEELLLLMLARCAPWYDKFVKDFLPQFDLGKIDELIKTSALEGILTCSRVTQKKENDGLVEVYPEGFDSLLAADKAASVQVSIVLELLLLVKKMLIEVTEPDAEVKKVVLTGGLSRSSFFQEVFCMGLEILQPGLELHFSLRVGPLTYKAAALGALINAIIGDKGGNISETIDKLCPTYGGVFGTSEALPQVESFLREHLV